MRSNMVQGLARRHSVPIIAVFALAVLTAQASLGAGPDAASEAAAKTKRVDHQYRSMLSGCAKGQSNRVSFIRVFDGFFPIPTTFVMVDSIDSQIEFSDLANPWVKPLYPSTVFYAPKEKFEHRWSWLTATRSSLSGERCGVSRHRYAHVKQFGGPAVVITNGTDYLLLIGPIADASEEAIACYVTASAQLGREC